MTDDTGQLTPEQSAESQQRSILGMHEGLRRLTDERDKLNAEVARLEARVEELEENLDIALAANLALADRDALEADLAEAVGLLRRCELFAKSRGLDSDVLAFLDKHPAPAKGASDES